MSPTLRGGSRTSVSARIHTYRSTSHSFGCRNKKGRPFGRPSSILFLLSIPPFALWARTGRFADARASCSFLPNCPKFSMITMWTRRINYCMSSRQIDHNTSHFVVSNFFKFNPKPMKCIVLLFGCVVVHSVRCSIQRFR